MPQFTIKIDADLKKIIRHAIDNESEGVYGQPPAGPNQLTLVKDSGAYFMSGAKGNLPRPDGEEGSLVKYLAPRVNPSRNEDCYEECRHVFGGDDFAEDLALTDNMVRAFEEDRLESLFLGVSASQFRFGATIRRA